MVQARMVIDVNLYGTLRLVAGKKNVPVDLPVGATVSDLLQELVRLYPALANGLFDERGDLWQGAPLFLNGRNPRLGPESIHAVLQPGDVISLFSPFASGRINVEAVRDLEGRGRRKDES